MSVLPLVILKESRELATAKCPRNKIISQYRSSRDACNMTGSVSNKPNFKEISPRNGAEVSMTVIGTP